jgi:hypothetical protein
MSIYTYTLLREEPVYAVRVAYVTYVNDLPGQAPFWAVYLYSTHTYLFYTEWEEVESTLRTCVCFPNSYTVFYGADDDLYSHKVMHQLTAEEVLRLIHSLPLESRGGGW